MMKIGLALPNTHKQLATPAVMSAGARKAEEVGFSSIWVNDHIVVPDRLDESNSGDRQSQYLNRRDQDIVEALVLMGFLAAATSRITIGTSVFGLPLRNPVIAAKQLASLDQLSDARVVLGVGLGWMREEYDILNVPFAHRGRRVDEWIKVLKELWSEDVATFKGEFFAFENAVMRPKPRDRRLPIWIGGRTEAGARRAARSGDAWHPSHFSLVELREWAPKLAQLCVENGRSPDAVAMTSRRRVSFVADHREDPDTSRILGGSAEQIIDGLGGLKEAGVSHMILELDVTDASEFVDRVQWLGELVLAKFEHE